MFIFVFDRQFYLSIHGLTLFVPYYEKVWRQVATMVTTRQNHLTLPQHAQKPWMAQVFLGKYDEVGWKSGWSELVFGAVLGVWNPNVWHWSWVDFGRISMWKTNLNVEKWWKWEITIIGTLGSMNSLKLLGANSFENKIKFIMLIYSANTTSPWWW